MSKSYPFKQLFYPLYSPLAKPVLSEVEAGEFKERLLIFYRQVSGTYKLVGIK
jgi:hypothetical protein